LAIAATCLVIRSGIDDVKQQSGIYIHYGRIERGILGEPVMAQLTAPAVSALSKPHRYTPTASGAKEDC